MSRKKMGSGLRKGTVERLKLALGQDHSIATVQSGLDKHEGNTEAYLTSIGLEPSDLLRLERYGFAKRGYGTHTNQYQRPAGYATRWVIIIPET